MQSYSTIIGVIELRLGGIGYRTTKARYGIGNSTITLIMKRFKETGFTLDDLKTIHDECDSTVSDTITSFCGAVSNTTKA